MLNKFDLFVGVCFCMLLSFLAYVVPTALLKEERGYQSRMASYDFQLEKEVWGND